jgi:hypothetical protein
MDLRIGLGELLLLAIFVVLLIAAVSDDVSL